MIGFNSFKPGSQPGSGISTPLEVVWFLSVLVFLINYTFEFLAFNHLYEAQLFLLPLLQSTLILWAIAEVLIGRRMQTSVPLGRLIIALLTQFVIGATRYPIGQFVNLHGPLFDATERYSEFGLATIYVPVYLGLFLTISKIVIDNFSYLDRQRAELLESEIVDRVHAEEAAKSANAALQVANAELVQTASTDPLTGVWNRRRFEEILNAEVAKARRYEIPVVLLILDVDHFKSINDHLGHATGDRVLKEMSQLLQHGTRQTDTLARWGGEEFVVIMPYANATEALVLADNLRLMVAHYEFVDAGTVTISIGAAAVKPEESVHEWFERVDSALYEAKSGGRNTVRVAS